MIARKDRHKNRGCFSRLVRAVVGLMLTVVIIVVGVPLAINAFVCASTRPEFHLFQVLISTRIPSGQMPLLCLVRGLIGMVALRLF